MSTGQAAIDLCVASTLPLVLGGISGNAMRNSINWDRTMRKLYVRDRHFENVGDLVLVHALAHIKVDSNNIGNDNDPRFVNEFYRGLRVCGRELFEKEQNNIVGLASAHLPN